MSEANKEIVRRVLEEYWHNGDEAIIDELFLDDFVNHDLSNPEQRGRKAFKEWGNGISTAFNTGFPGWRVTIEDLVAEGDRVAKRWILRGTHKGEYFGVAPTGKQVAMRAVTIYHFAGGKVKEIWWNYDIFGLMQQIGAISTG
jgi:predicted ester cyclase